MHVAWLWGAAALAYAAFWTWYVGFKRPLSKPEVAAYLGRLAPGLTAGDPERRERMREFLESDDGGEFFMVNLIRIQPGLVTPPGGGAPAPAQQVLQGYTGPFLRALLARGGHPALGGRAAAGYLEAWGVTPNPGWTMVGVIRYRSRRDLIELATMPQFAPIHAFKEIAMSNTLAFPIAPARTFFGPRVVVALLVALIAALGHIALAALGGV
jgi:hypothetical protein